MAAIPRPPPLWEDLRSLPRAFWVLFAGTFINRFGSFVWPFLTIYMTGRGFTVENAGAAIACSGLGSIIGGALGGWLSDRAGRRTTIVAGSFGAAFFYFLLYFAEGLPLILWCVLLGGVAAGTYHPASSALLADLVPEGQRVRAYSALRLALNAGFAGGTACAGFLAQKSYFWLFAGDALTTCLFGLLALLWLPQGLTSRGQKAPWSEALRHLRGNLAFHALFIGSLCLGLLNTQYATTYPLHVLERAPDFHFAGWDLHGTQVYGLLLAWNGLLVVVAELPLTGTILRFHPRQILALGYALEGVGFAMNFFCHSFESLFVAMTIFTVGEMATAPVSSAYLAQVAPERMRGRYMGALSLAYSFSAVLGPLAGTRLLTLHAPAYWLTALLLGAVGAASIIGLGRVRSAVAAEGGA